MKRILFVFLLLAAPVFAVQPDEVLDDPILEQRAREISKELRCPVCQNESIDESNAPISRDLRLLLRERLVAGDSDEEAVEYIVARYGEFVLLKPTRSGANLLLWIAAPTMLLLALAIGWRTITARKETSTELSEDEKERLETILNS